MKLNSEVSEIEVYDHWSKADHTEAPVTDPSSRRADIINPLRKEFGGKWYLATIQDEDIEKINIISSSDWEHKMQLCEAEDYKVITASKNLNKIKRYIDDETRDRLKKIQDMITFLSGGGTFENKLIIVGTSLEGPFTVIDGNHRSVALFHSNKFVDVPVYFYMYPAGPYYNWSRKSK